MEKTFQVIIFIILHKSIQKCTGDLVKAKYVKQLQESNQTQEVINVGTENSSSSFTQINHNKNIERKKHKKKQRKIIITKDREFEVTTTPGPLPPVTKGDNYKKLLEESDFGFLTVVERKSRRGSDSIFPYMGRVIPTIYLMRSTLCTCVCIADRIFITAARCVFGLTAGLVNVDYLSYYLSVYAIVVSEKPTVRWFDDIGLIVTEDSDAQTPFFKPIKLFPDKRTDDYFKWFDDLNYEYSRNRTHFVVGFYSNYEWSAFNRQVRSLEVFVGIRFCYAAFERRVIPAPCYSFCRSPWYADYIRRDAFVCDNYFSGEGFAIVDLATNNLLGIATWTMGTYWESMTPVGFSVPNSDDFYKNFECAKKIANGTATKGSGAKKSFIYTDLQLLCK